MQQFTAALQSTRMIMPDISKPQEIRPDNGQAGATMWTETHAVADAAHQETEAMRQRGRAAAEALRHGTHATVEATRHGTQAGVEAMRRVGETAGETVRRSTQVVAEGQRQIAQETAQTFQEVSRKMAQVAHGTTEEVRQLSALPHAAEGGLRDMRQGIAGLVESVVRTNLRATQELFRLANPVAIIELQQRCAREYLDTVMQGTVTLVRAVRRTTDESLHPLEAQLQQRQKAYRG